MEQKIDQLAQEMTTFCRQELATSHSLPAELKTAFIRTKGKILSSQLDEIRRYYPAALTTFVVISLLVGNIEGPWWGGQWMRAY